MKREFVGGIAVNSLGEILLIERSSNDADMGGLWSLPAGEVDEGENKEDALIREFGEETGLIITCGELFTTVEREKWAVNIYKVSIIGGELTEGLDKDINSLSYFKIENLPEKIVLEARIALIKYITEERDIDFYPDYAESIFSSLHYSYLVSHFDDYKSLINFDIYKYISFYTPLKKYKSCIPYLLSSCNNDIKSECILSEIVFCIWALVDDISDFRETKYESNTSLSNFSFQKNISSIYIAIKDIEIFLARHSNIHLSEIVTKCLLNNATSQIDRFSRKDFSNIEDYITSSQKRSEFLGKIWSYALKKAECFDEAILIEDIYPYFSKIGQILNDYYDYKYSYKLEDIENQTVSYLSLKLFREMESAGQTNKFYNCWANKKRHEYILLLEEYQIPSKIETDIKEDLNILVNKINNSTISLLKKDLLILWLDIQFGKFIDFNLLKLSKIQKLSLLNDKIDAICQTIK